MKRRVILVVVLAVLMIFTASTVLAGKPDNSKATGGVTWTNTNSEREFKAQFNAIQGFGDKDDKGFFRQVRTDGAGGIRVDITEVVVGDGYAILKGPIVKAWGVYEDWLGDPTKSPRWIYVEDGGSGTDERGEDYIVTGHGDAPNLPISGFNVSGGNVQVHYVAAE